MTFIQNMAKKKLLWFAIPTIMMLLGMALFAPWVAPHNPNEVNLELRLMPSSSSHLLGTDHLGRDTLSRLIWGARTSLGSVFVIVTLVLVFSLFVGSIAGYRGGALDSFLMRVCEIFLTFPTFILAMFLIGVLGMGMINVILAIFLTHWAWYARIIRGLVLSLKNRDYILASKVCGTPAWKIIFRHLTPPVLAQIIVLATLDIGHMMLHVSGLSFLGLGIQAPTPEWGVMISDARQYIWTQPELILYPGLMIFIGVLAFNIPGDMIRDSLDPTLVEGDL
ncbi:nickel ABC transporter permease subunit NikC [Desulfoluna sp.]|uniref:nickel ABC transporter permease subunit NikC n=1 Tax=Desulfoluna sp. TaxID=2045199 RepID=UPI00263516DC|nr:nickel ABC transporter permease subunit NikC [Desulfoluna sp.]